MGKDMRKYITEQALVKSLSNNSPIVNVNKFK